MSIISVYTLSTGFKSAPEFPGEVLRESGYLKQVIQQPREQLLLLRGYLINKGQCKHNDI